MFTPCGFKTNHVKSRTNLYRIIFREIHNNTKGTEYLFYSIGFQ